MYSSRFLLHEVQKQSTSLVTNAVKVEKVLNEENVKSHRPNVFKMANCSKKQKSNTLHYLIIEVIKMKGNKGLDRDCKT